MGHWALQAPQCALSVWGFLQVLLQLTSGAVHDVVHWPMLQSCPEAHRLAQVPQFVSSVCGSTQNPEQGVI